LRKIKAAGRPASCIAHVAAATLSKGTSEDITKSNLRLLDPVFGGSFLAAS
jgi:hypothetical protein